MDTRTIRTNTWDRPEFERSSNNAKYLKLYLLTSKHVNICNMFPLSDKKMCFDMSIEPEDLKLAKEELEESDQAYFIDGWCAVPDGWDGQNYAKSNSNLGQYLKQIRMLPAKVYDHFLLNAPHLFEWVEAAEEAQADKDRSRKYTPKKYLLDDD